MALSCGSAFRSGASGGHWMQLLSSCQIAVPPKSSFVIAFPSRVSYLCVYSIKVPWGELSNMTSMLPDLWIRFNEVSARYLELHIQVGRTGGQISSLISELLFLLERSWGSHQIQILHRVCLKNFCFFPPSRAPFDVIQGSAKRRRVALILFLALPGCSQKPLVYLVTFVWTSVYYFPFLARTKGGLKAGTPLLYSTVVVRPLFCNRSSESSFWWKALLMY